MMVEPAHEQNSQGGGKTQKQQQTTKQYTYIYK